MVYGVSNPNKSIPSCRKSLSETFQIFLFKAHQVLDDQHTFLPQEIHPNSPAAQAGLIPHTDYILGSDTMVGDDDLYTLIENNNHKELKLFVYNSESDACREVST